MVKRLPRDVSSIEFVFPSDCAVEDILKALKRQLLKEADAKKKATILFGVALPVCVLIDVLTIGFVLTLVDFILLVASWRAWWGTKTTYKVVQSQKTGNKNPSSSSSSKKPKQQKVFLTPSDFLRQFRQKSFGELTEQDLEELREYCHDEEAGKTVTKLREYYRKRDEARAKNQH